MINVTHDRQLLTFVVRGRLAAPGVVDAINTHYSGLGTRNILWDLTHTDSSDLTAQDFSWIAAETARRMVRGRERKTAYVVGDRASFAKLCQYLNVAFVTGVPAEYAVFRELATAHGWLAQA